MIGEMFLAKKFALGEKEAMIYDLQKASILKRISAFLLDFILVVILATGFVFLISWIVDFDGKIDRINQLDEKYFLQYDLGKYIEVKEGEQPTLSITQEIFDKLSDEGKDAYNNARLAYQAESGHDLLYDYRTVFGLAFMMVSLGIFFSVLIFEFILPLIFKHGRTVGKKIFGVGVMLINGVKINNVALFVRAMLGKYAVETMVPVFMVFMFLLYPNLIILLVALAVLVLQLILVIATKNNSLIHDILSSTVVVDMATQMIFDSPEHLLSYKEEKSRQQAEQAQYK